MRTSTEWYFQAYVHPLTLVPLFKYFGRILTASDDDCPAVMENLSKAQKKWGKPTVLGFLKAVVQSVLLFILKTWVMTLHMGRDLGGFQHKVYREIRGIQP